MKESLFENWHLMRWIALIAGLFFGVQALLHSDWISALLGVFFLFQAYTNSGCIAGACSPAPQKKNNGAQAEHKEPEFTEIT